MCVERCVTGTKMFSVFFISLRKIYFLFQKFHWVFCALTNINGVQWASLSTASTAYSIGVRKGLKISLCAQKLMLCVCACVCVCVRVRVHARTCFVAQSSCPALCNPMDCSPPRVGCHFLLQGIFPIQALNPSLLCLMHWQADSFPLYHKQILNIFQLKWQLFSWKK